MCIKVFKVLNDFKVVKDSDNNPTPTALKTIKSLIDLKDFYESLFLITWIAFYIDIIITSYRLLITTIASCMTIPICSCISRIRSTIILINSNIYIRSIIRIYDNRFSIIAMVLPIISYTLGTTTFINCCRPSLRRIIKQTNIRSINAGRHHHCECDCTKTNNLFHNSFQFILCHAPWRF